MNKINLINYYSEKSLEHGIEIGDNQKGDTFTKQEIKSNSLLFMEYFMVFSEKFAELFKDVKFSEEEKKELSELKRLYFDLTELNMEYQVITTEYGKSETEKLIRNLIIKNPKISEFFDLCWEVYGL